MDIPKELLSKELLSQFKPEEDVSKFLMTLHSRVLEQMLEGEIVSLERSRVFSRIRPLKYQLCIWSVTRVNTLSTRRKRVYCIIMPPQKRPLYWICLSKNGEQNIYTLSVPGGLIRWVYFFFDFLIEIRKIIYTTNLIENLNRKIRKYTKNKHSFPNDEALKMSVYLSSSEIEKKWYQPIWNWGLIFNQFLTIFGNRIRV